MAKTKILTKDGLEIYDGKIKEHIDTALEDKVSKTDIVDNLSSTATDAPLSAKQGKILKDTIDRLEVPGAMNYKGTLGTDGDITVLPSTYKRGDTYLVKTAGTYSEKECDVGDFLICVRDNILTVATIPTNYRDTYPAYIIYQIYNPQTGENGEVYFTAIQGGQWYFDVQDGQKQLYATGGAFGWSFSSNDNGVTWTEVNRDVWYGTLFTETETSAIKILHSTFNVYNNDNSIQYSINPYGLSGYATDWAIIQGNIDDKVSKSDIVDNLESDSTDAPLSAKQGKELKESIDKVDGYVQKGAKNLLKVTQSTGSIGNGVTCTINEDKSISLSGTQAGFTIGAIYIGEAYLKANTEYILSGCPEGGSESTCYLKVHTSSDGNTNVGFVDIGEGTIFTIDTDGVYKVSTILAAGVSYDSVVYKPMIRLATVEDDTYEPYYVITSVNYLNDNALVHGDIVDNLTSTATDLPLSANQGKVLNSILSKKAYFSTVSVAGGESKSFKLNYPSSALVIVSMNYGPGGYGVYHLTRWSSFNYYTLVSGNNSGAFEISTTSNGITITGSSSGGGLAMCTVISQEENAISIS